MFRQSSAQTSTHPTNALALQGGGTDLLICTNIKLLSVHAVARDQGLASGEQHGHEAGGHRKAQATEDGQAGGAQTSRDDAAGTLSHVGAEHGSHVVAQSAYLTEVGSVVNGDLGALVVRDRRNRDVMVIRCRRLCAFMCCRVQAFGVQPFL
jgi:hypothetical protein